MSRCGYCMDHNSNCAITFKGEIHSWKCKMRCRKLASSPLQKYNLPSAIVFKWQGVKVTWCIVLPGYQFICYTGSEQKKQHELRYPSVVIHAVLFASSIGFPHRMENMEKCECQRSGNFTQNKWISIFTLL